MYTYGCGGGGIASKGYATLTSGSNEDADCDDLGEDDSLPQETALRRSLVAPRSLYPPPLLTCAPPAWHRLFACQVLSAMDPEALISLVVFTGVVSVYRIGRAGAAVADVLPGRETLTDKVKRRKNEGGNRK